ncbi:hypothetical protein LAN15_23615, partial [Mycobacterium tuberculosis]|nr:hypothetical protein [Mycobacterium tuberculosis]
MWPGLRPGAAAETQGSPAGERAAHRIATVRDRHRILPEARAHGARRGTVGEALAAARRAREGPG